MSSWLVLWEVMVLSLSAAEPNRAARERVTAESYMKAV